MSVEENYFLLDNNLMKRVGLFLLFLLCFLSALFSKSKYSFETEHFSFIFSENTEESAKEVIEKAESYYSLLVDLFSIDPEVKIPVYLTDEYKSYNAYSSLYPSNHIVLFVTATPSYFLSNSVSPLELTFFHELTHSFTQSIKSEGVSILTKVFGDSFVPGNLYMNKSFIEGIAVLMESLNGEGRLNDPYSLSLLNSVALENIDLSYKDIAGSRDTTPVGNLSYILGASFLSYLKDRFGLDYVTSFVRKCYLFPLGTLESIFSSVFGSSLSSLWSDFIASLYTDKSVIIPRRISEYGSFKELTIHEGKLYLKDTSSSYLYKLTDDEVLERIDISSSSLDALSFSQSYYLSPYIGEKERRVEIRELNGNGKIVFDSYYSGLLLSDDEVLLLNEKDRNFYLSLYSLPEKEELGYIELGRNISVDDFILLPNNRVAFLLGEEGKVSITIFNLDSFSLEKLILPSSIGLFSLSLNSDSSLSFSFVDKTDNRSFVKYGEIREEGGEWLYKLSNENYVGGVNSPVKLGDKIYFVSSFFSGSTLSVLDYSSLSFTLEEKAERSERITEKEKKKTVENKRDYFPLKYMTRGTLFPFAFSDNKFISSPSGLGLAFITQDPTEEHSVFLSSGYSLERKNPFAFASCSYRDIFKISTLGILNNNKLLYEIDLSLNYKYNLHSYNHYFTFSDTVGLIGYDSSIAWANYFSFYYQNAYKSGVGRYDYLGYWSKVELYDLTPIFSVGLILPRLLPLNSQPNYSLSWPLSLHTSVIGIDKPIIEMGGNITFLTYEIQKTIVPLSIYLRNLDFSGDLNFNFNTNTQAWSEEYKLSLSLALSPVIGYFSTIGGKASVTLKYIKESGLFLSFAFSLEE